MVSLPNGVDDESLVDLFVSWLKDTAKEHCVAVAGELSHQSGLTYKKLAVPEHLLRHVILHELSHSVHMNHSEEFWSLLHSLDEHSVQHDKQLTEAWKFLPGWLD